MYLIFSWINYSMRQQSQMVNSVVHVSYFTFFFGGESPQMAITKYHLEGLSMNPFRFWGNIIEAKSCHNPKSFPQR